MSTCWGRTCMEKRRMATHRHTRILRSLHVQQRRTLATKPVARATTPPTHHDARDDEQRVAPTLASLHLAALCSPRCIIRSASHVTADGVLVATPVAGLPSGKVMSLNDVDKKRGAKVCPLHALSLLCSAPLGSSAIDLVEWSRLTRVWLLTVMLESFSLHHADLDRSS